jgi:hypothetical protein
MMKPVLAILMLITSIGAVRAEGESPSPPPEPFEFKVDPPLCETTIVEKVFPADRECVKGTDEYGPGTPANGDLNGCDGAGPGGIAYVNGKFQTGEYAYVPAMEHSRRVTELFYVW